MVARVIPVDPFDLVVFGATGDLALRKIMPALCCRFADGQMPTDARVIGAARGEMTTGAYRAEVAQALDAVLTGPDTPSAQTRRDFLDRLDYITLDARGEEGWPALRDTLRPDPVRSFYFAVAPSLFGALAERLDRWSLITPQTRIVAEKPFGHDQASARALNAALAQHFTEAQIYRIDHYLGKETVQNLMAVRFANILFEPLWNARFIDHVQITVAETVGVGGRGDYYAQTGAMRDMVQNHLMQLLCLIAMEPPHRFDPDAMRDEKLKVIRALDPLAPGDIVRGQYSGGRDTPSFADETGEAGENTESYVALRAGIANWRWKGTPFYLRTGKRLSRRVSEIAVTFRDPPHSIFGEGAPWRENVLVIRLQPDEGMDLRVMIKEPGPGGMRLKDVALDMSFAEALGDDLHIPDAYERLIMDVIRGNQTLFMRSDEVEAAWAWVDPVIAGFGRLEDAPVAYAPGSDGPDQATELLRRDGRQWREIR